MLTRKSSTPWAETEAQFPEAFLNLSSSIDSKSPESWFGVGGWWRDLVPVICGNVTGTLGQLPGLALHSGPAKRGPCFEPPSPEEGLKLREVAYSPASLRETEPGCYPGAPAPGQLPFPFPHLSQPQRPWFILV